LPLTLYFIPKKAMDKTYWNNRYLNQDTPWDTGSITTPLSRFIDDLTDKEMTILIPGAGPAHEAAYLIQKGFKNVYICDFAEAAIKAVEIAYPNIPTDRLLCEDFFKLDLNVDLIIEQTFFCAMPRSFRKPYVEKVHELLNTGGLLAGLFFAQEFEKDGPPFGGTKAEYLRLFTPYFDVLEMDIAVNSIKPRAGAELFFRMLAL